MKYYLIYALCLGLALIQAVFNISQGNWNAAMAWSVACLAWTCAYKAAQTGENWRQAYQSRDHLIKQLELDDSLRSS